MNSASLLAEAGHSLSDLLGVGSYLPVLDPADGLTGLCHPCDVENIEKIAYGCVSMGL
jgi:hypothetical protein